LGLDLEPMVFEVKRQILDAHVVDAGRSLVAPDMGQRLPHIVALDNGFHRRSNGRQVFGDGGRRPGLRPSGRGAPGFTLSRRPQGQF